VSDAEFLHTLTPAESDALEAVGEPGEFPRGFLMDHPRAAIALLELCSRRLREAEARGS
jgi:hypothetical protein